MVAKAGNATCRRNWYKHRGFVCHKADAIPLTLHLKEITTKIKTEAI